MSNKDKYINQVKDTIINKNLCLVLCGTLDHFSKGSLIFYHVNEKLTISS